MQYPKKAISVRCDIAWRQLHVHDTFIPDRDRITSAHLVEFERLHTE
jgi:hypothetical protein